MAKATFQAPILAGFTVRSREDAEEGLDISPPNSYSAAQKAKWLEDKRGEIPFFKITGHVTRVAAVDVKRQEVFESANAPGCQPGYEFLGWVLASYPAAGFMPVSASAPLMRPAAFYGFDVADLVRIAGFEMVAGGTEIPLGLWHGNEDCHDPYCMLVESGARKVIPLQKVFKRLDIPAPADYVPHQDPLLDIVLTAELIRSAWLVPQAIFGDIDELLARKWVPNTARA